MMLIRTMTFNIRNGLANDGANSWEFRRHLTAKVIRDAAADVIGLQEVYDFQLSFLLSELPEYQFYSVGREDGMSQGEHCTILWNRDSLQRAKSGTFWLSDTPETPNSMSWGNQVTRICSWVEFAEGFHFLNTHWDHESQLARERSGDLISESLPKTDWILVGDFNATPSSKELLSFAALADMKFLTKVNQYGTFHDFRGGGKGNCIDHIFSSYGFKSSPITIISEHDGDLFPSDHYPVTADLEI